MEKGELRVNVSPEDLRQFRAAGWLGYKNLGAKGDWKTDDIDAISAKHAVANSYQLQVKADDGAVYYIGGKERTAIIRTDCGGNRWS